MNNNYKYYVDFNNLHCVVGTTCSFDGYDDMVDGMQEMADSCTEPGPSDPLHFTEVPAPEEIDYDGLVW